jgi:hypothetical protein
MTPPTQDDLAAGRELDAKVAEKIFGLTVRRGLVRLAYYEMEMEVLEEGDEPLEGMQHEEDYIAGDRLVPCYSTDIAAAWLVLDEMVWRVGTANIRLDMEDYGRGAGTAGRAERAVWVTIGEHTAVGPAPLAICKAALAALSEQP